MGVFLWMSVFVYLYSQLLTSHFSASTDPAVAYTTLIVLPIFPHPFLTYQATNNYTQHPKRQSKFPQGITTSLAPPSFPLPTPRNQKQPSLPVLIPPSASPGNS